MVEQLIGRTHIIGIGGERTAQKQEYDSWNNLYNSLLAETRGKGSPDGVLASSIKYLRARVSLAEELGEHSEAGRLAGWLALLTYEWSERAIQPIQWCLLDLSGRAHIR